ncbi:MAG: [NiFe]-hydrogenase assembly chaperone HybE [Magnetococcales bacterium]|nr:[NiFe]-hydrogenase assembly chaperone HybE [Magnetococcales bacterium]
MSSAGWMVTTMADEALMGAVEAEYRQVYARHVTEAWAANESLPITTRYYRDDPPWKIFLLLTPWMLARLFFAGDEPVGFAPRLPLPVDGGSPDEGAQLFQLGPVVSFALHGQPQKGHMQWSAGLGHFLLQPLILNMAPYVGAESAFAAWSDTVARRDALLSTMKRNCGWQKEVSRRELFGRGIGNRSDRHC